jgi:hypothetical protein
MDINSHNLKKKPNSPGSVPGTTIQKIKIKKTKSSTWY